MVGTVPTTEGSPSARGAIRVLSGAFVCLVVLVLVAAMLAVWEGRQAAIRESEDRQVELGIVLADQAARAMQAVDAVLAATVAQIQAGGVSTVDDMRREMATEAVHRDLVETLRNLPQLDAITLQDSTGHAVNSSRFWPSAAVDLSASEVSQHFQDSTDDGPYLSQTEEGHLPGQWTVLLGRRIRASDGRFVGVAVGALSLTFFADFCATIDPENREVVTLLRRDGTILMRHPQAPGFVGRILPEGSPWYKTVGAGGGLYDAPGLSTDRPGRPRSRSGWSATFRW